ncbi:polyamine-modulated factor 1-binding protein [Thalictrum thalictroides]|uniref:Polyamine-modulated factor 1-binding protein n=1 Tax=Thalictrum thalictroides TaxID=46969 RepID=A0A7J6WNQ0_THATH|nr:polyamine-modulated factor 1-binding protein [Thalictrum thalictroides]
METSKSIVAMSSPSETLALPPAESEAESQLSSLIFDLSQQVNGAMEDMLKMINDVDQISSGIMEEIEKSKESAIERKKILEDDRERFQRAAYTVLDMFNNRENN